MKKFLTQSGFSLIEALVAISVIATVGIVLSLITIRVFRASDTTNAFGIINQNGQTAMSDMQTTIRQAKSIICTGTGVMVVEDSNGNLIRYSADTTGGVGSIRKDSPLKNADPNLNAQFCVGPLTFTGQKVLLTNTDPNNGVNLTNLSFVRLSGNESDSVRVFFDLSSGVGLVSAGEEKRIDSSGIRFETTVKLRN